MFNRRSGLVAAVIAGVMFAAAAPAVAQYGVGVGVQAGVGVGYGGGYGYAQPYGYSQPGYGYAQPGYGYGYAQPGYGYGYAQPGYGYGQQSYGAPVYTAHTTYYAQPSYAQPSYGYAQPGYGTACCSWWDKLWGNCCAQPSYQPVAAAVPSYAPSGYGHGHGVTVVNHGSMYVGHGGAAPVAHPHHSGHAHHAHHAPYVAPGPRYVRPRVRRHVVYRPVYQRPHVIYRTRVVTRTRVIAAPRRQPAVRFDVSPAPATAAPQRKVLEPQR
jgi:hypothetical protein